jgi:hypothetical protein
VHAPMAYWFLENYNPLRAEHVMTYS